jgi:hypothetical protein
LWYPRFDIWKSSLFSAIFICLQRWVASWRDVWWADAFSRKWNLIACINSSVFHFWLQINC